MRACLYVVMIGSCVSAGFQSGEIGGNREAKHVIGLCERSGDLRTLPRVSEQCVCACPHVSVEGYMRAGFRVRLFGMWKRVNGNALLTSCLLSALGLREISVGLKQAKILAKCVQVLHIAYCGCGETSCVCVQECACVPEAVCNGRVSSFNDALFEYSTDLVSSRLLSSY